MSKPKVKVKPKPMPVRHMTLSPGPSIEYNGKTWKLSFNTQDAKAQLEELIREHVVRDAIKTKRLIGGEEGQQAYLDATRPLENGEYDTFGSRWIELLAKPAGVLLFLLSLMKKHHPDATIEDARLLYVREQEQTESALEAVSPNFFSALSEQMGSTKEEAAIVATDIAKQLANAARKKTEAGPGSSIPSNG